MTIFGAQFGTTQVSWVEFKDADEKFEFYKNLREENLNSLSISQSYYRSATSFVYHNYFDQRIHGDDEVDPLADDSRQIRIWNAVKKLIPSFGDYKNIDITTEFEDRVFSPILPESSFKDAHCYRSTALRIFALIPLLFEIPVRYLATFIFCRIMDIYSFKNPDFAEYYKFRATIYNEQPFVEITKIIVWTIDSPT